MSHKPKAEKLLDVVKEPKTLTTHRLEHTEATILRERVALSTEYSPLRNQRSESMFECHLHQNG